MPLIETQRGHGMEKLVVMSKKELDRYTAMEQVIEKRVKQVKTAELLGVSDRHFRRLLKAYREEGAQGLVSKKRGKPSNRRLPDKLKRETLKLMKTKYDGFGPTLAREKLIKEHQIKVGKETLRQWMIEEGIWEEKKKKRPKLHQSRTRRAREGELIQIDGSPHDWFEGRRGKCCLLGFIDDATSKIMHLQFEESETTKGYLKSFQNYIKKHGKPQSCYSDRHSIFRITRKEEGYIQKGITQLGRALKELDVELICANSPQAKGRIERLFNTLQDRLVKEMRLKKINTIEEANNYLPEYIKEHNAKFSVEAHEKENMHRKAKEPLEEILCYKTERKISKNLELSYEGKILQIKTKRPTFAMRQGKATIVETLEGQIKIIYQGKELEHKELETKRQGRIRDKKSLLNERVA